ncbi:MAG: hypothetical protein HZB26_17950 [Candidatus Hydrogenedentes bacterium]|nr:hypothetical protein [Candidatus Hydrogenedentota bacterium]
MSSILDALKKLEEEKAEAAQATPVEFEDDAAEQDLVRGGRPPQLTIQFSPMTVTMLLAGVVAVVALVMGVNYLRLSDASHPVGAGASVAQSRIPTVAAPANVNAQPSAAIAPQDETAPSAVAPSAATPQTTAPAATPAPTAAPAPQVAPPSAPVRVASVPSSEEAALKPAAPVPSAKSRATLAAVPSAKETALPRKTALPDSSRSAATPVSQEDTLPEPPSASAATQAASPPSPKTNPASPAFDMYALPILTESDKLRLGLKGMEVNMLRSPSKNRPNPSAIINMQQVYVNETIQGTKAKLIGVDVRGVAIEVGGERFFVRR